MRKSKAEVVLSRLLEGMPVKFPGDSNTYWLQDGIFGIEATKTDTKKAGWSEQVVLGVDINLPTFIAWCNKFSDDEIFILGCEKVLKQINQTGGTGIRHEIRR